MTGAPQAAYLTAAAAHAGFQTTVTLLVYPALARVRSAHWREQHDRHSRAIVPLVAVLYAALVGTGAWLLVAAPHWLDAVAVAPAALTLLVTAALAAPLHRGLTRRDDVLLARLLAVDRARTALALLALALALVVALV